ncbi:PepSY domain-containing protein, partial [Mycobacterium marinum]|uniref:PepSY domain-containing protein n=1 Tax=Mycobacterium marinum TaxID=1781 RepID=UPI0035678C7C
PADRATAFTVTQTRQPWVLSNNAVAVDGTTGAITDVSWFADWPLAAKLTAWGIQLHMGLLFGPANQVLLLG